MVASSDSSVAVVEVAQAALVWIAQVALLKIAQVTLLERAQMALLDLAQRPPPIRRPTPPARGNRLGMPCNCKRLAGPYPRRAPWLRGQTCRPALRLLGRLSRSCRESCPRRKSHDAR